MTKFLSDITRPEECEEEDRAVFLAFKNRIVNAAQDAACQKIYGHGAFDFKSGELVIAERPVFFNFKDALWRWHTIPYANNQDELTVEAIHYDQPGKWGVPTRLRNIRTGKEFTAEYLSEEEINDVAHPFNLELIRRQTRARELATEYKKDERNHTLNIARREAWSAFYELKDRTVIAFRHPFASTAHKAQGSTYRAVYAPPAELLRHNRAALYVACTRPRLQLNLGV